MNKEKCPKCGSVAKVDLATIAITGIAPSFSQLGAGQEFRELAYSALLRQFLPVFKKEVD